jgi:DNA-binding FrmR family transcriptional regulator
MKTLSQRLNNIIGQIEGVKKMAQAGDNCVEVLTQLKAIKSAVSGVMNMVVDEEIDNCLLDLDDNQKKLLIKIKNYVKAN